jgi:hypothetical protein
MPAKPAMQALRPTLSPRRRLVWLLWLLLLLPLAQTAANLHVLSHAASDLTGGNASGDRKPAIDHAHCDLCLMAAALTSCCSALSAAIKRAAHAAGHLVRQHLAGAGLPGLPKPRSSFLPAVTFAS